MDVSPWSLAVAIIELATFDQVENHLKEREQLRALTATLRAQMAQARNALAVNETWLRANSALVRGWKAQSKEAKDEGAR